MSGGHFEYTNERLGNIANQLNLDLAANEVDPIYENEQTASNVRELLNLLPKVQLVLREYDYFLCGDSSEEEFNQVYFQEITKSYGM